MKDKGLKRKLIHYAAVLTSVCLVSAAVLSLLYYKAHDKIREKEQEAFLEKLTDVMGDAEEPKEIIKYAATVPFKDRIYVSDTSTGVRYAAMGAAQGYQSEVGVLLSLDAPRTGAPLGDDPVIYRLSVVASSETPGLGENIRKVETDESLWGAAWEAVAGSDASRPPTEKKRPAFQEQFSGKRLSDLVIDRAAETGRIVPVTGATITSTAVVEAARQAAARIIEKTQQLYGAPE